MAKRRRSKKKSLKQQGQGCLFLIIIAVGIFIFFSGDNDNTPSNTSSSSVNRFRAVTAVSDNGSRDSADDDSPSTSESTDEAEPTSTPKATNTPRPTATPRQQATLYITSNANTRECPELDCDVITAYRAGDEVIGVAQEKGAKVAGSDVWWFISGTAGDVYVHSSLLSTSRPAPASNANASTSNQNSNDTNNSVAATAAPAAVSRPGNCATAQAMGLTAQQAAQWSHLDRDGDGVACYGD